MSVRILSYLNRSQTELLVSASPSVLLPSSQRAVLRKIIRMIRPLKPSEQITHRESLFNKKHNEIFLVHVMPNLSEIEKNNYISKILDYLKSRRIKTGENPYKDRESYLFPQIFHSLKNF